MTTTIEEAYKTYNDAEDAAHIAYRDFWIERFKARSIIFMPPPDPSWAWSPFKASAYGYEIDGYTNPSRYEGMKLYIYPAAGQPPRTGPRYYSVKVKSETGFKRLIRRLATNYYK